MLHFGGRTISRASSRDSWLCEPASLRGCHLSVGLRCPAASQSSTGEPVIRRPWVQEDRNVEIRNGRGGNLESTTPEGTIKTMRVVQPCSGSFWGSWLPDRLRQPDYLPPGSVRLDEGRRLSALRPYLTAGLPLSVQSMLIKELAWIGNEGKHD